MIKDLMQKEEKLLAEFMRLLFVDNNSVRESFIQERLTTLRVMEIQEIEFMRDFPCAETKEKRLLLRLFPNQLSIESILEKKICLLNFPKFSFFSIAFWNV